MAHTPPPSPRLMNTAHACISVSSGQPGHTCVCICVCLLVYVCVHAQVLSAVWICRRPAYRSPWAHEGPYGGRGLGAADMTAQFKEMEQEMQAESEQSCLYIHLGWAWENSTAPRPSLWSQAGSQVDLQVLHSAQNQWSVEKKFTMSRVFHWELSVDGWHRV